jgi:hypothetical protein
MNQVAGNQMRLYDLPSKLLCRVLNVELKVRPLPARVFPPISPPISVSSLFAQQFLS